MILDLHSSKKIEGLTRYKGEKQDYEIDFFFFSFFVFVFVFVFVFLKRFEGKRAKEEEEWRKKRVKETQEMKNQKRDIFFLSFFSLKHRKKTLDRKSIALET